MSRRKPPTVPAESAPVPVPKYRRHASGQARVELAGRTVYLGAYGSPESLQAYARAIAEWQAGGGHAPPVPAAPITVAQLVAGFVQAHAGRYRRNESRNYRTACRPLLRLYADTPAAEFGPRALKTVRQAYVAAGYVRKTVNGYVGRIRRMFKWAVSEELVPVGTFQALRTVEGLRRGKSAAPEGGRVRPVAAEAVEAVRPHVTPAVWAMVSLQRLTGMRPGEVVAMRTGDVDRSGDVWLYRPADHKTAHVGRDRFIDLGPKAQAVLTPFLKADPAAFCFSPAESMRGVRAAAIAERKARGGVGNHKRRRHGRRHVPGSRYSVASYRRAIARACERAFPPPAGLRRRPGETAAAHAARLGPEALAELCTWRRRHGWHPHQLRHSYATEIRRRYGVEAARIGLGHASLDVTELYAERDRALARRIALEVG